MKLPNTIISLIFNEIEEKEWSNLFFLFMDEIEWKIYHHLKDINTNKNIKKNCKNRNIFTIFTILKKNKLNWNFGLYVACYFGHFSIVKLIIESGVDYNSNTLLKKACFGGNLNIINYIIKKGGLKFNNGLFGACKGNHPHIVKLMILLGATRCNYCKKSIKDH